MLPEKPRRFTDNEYFISDRIKIDAQRPEMLGFFPFSFGLVAYFSAYLYFRPSVVFGRAAGLRQADRRWRAADAATKSENTVSAFG